MLPSMPVLFPRDSQSGDGLLFNPVASSSRSVEPVLKIENQPVVAPEPVPLPSVSQKKEEQKDETQKDEDVQEIRFVTSYYNKVQTKLGIEKFQKFKEILNNFRAEKESPVELYRRLEGLLGDDELLEEFLMFLTPGQACEVGRLMDHLMLAKINKFIQHLQTTFARKPAKLRKVMKTLMTSINGDIGELKARVEPQIRTNQRLLQYFRALFPEHRPPDCLYTEQHTEEFPESAWAEDRGVHCIDLEESNPAQREEPAKSSLDVTYIQGRVFLQNGRVLRPAQVTFPGSALSSHEHTLRLAPAASTRLTLPAPAPDSDYERSPRRKNLKSPKRTHSKSPCVRNIMKKEKTKSPERAGKHANETTKKSVKVILDSQIEAKSAERRLPESTNGTTISLNNDEFEIFHMPEHRDVVRSKRKLDQSPEDNAEDTKTKKKHSKRDAKKTEETQEDNGKSHSAKNKSSSEKDKTKNKKESHKKAEAKQEQDATKSEAKTFSDTDFIKPKPKESKSDSLPKCDWTREEDKTILLILKRDTGSEETFTKMRELLPHRTLTELQERFFHVMDLLRQMALGEVT